MLDLDLIDMVFLDPESSAARLVDDDFAERFDDAIPPNTERPFVTAVNAERVAIGRRCIPLDHRGTVKGGGPIGLEFAFDSQRASDSATA